MLGQLIRQLEAVQLELDQVVGQCPLIRVKVAVLVTVGQAPNFGKHRIGQLGLDELILGRGARYFAIDRIQIEKGVIGLLARPLHNPIAFVDARVYALGLADAERTRLVIESAAAHRSLLRQLVVLFGQHLHELCYVSGQHVLRSFDELLVKRLERFKIKQLQYLSHFIYVGKVSRRYIMHMLYLLIDPIQIFNNLPLLRVLAKHRRHLLLYFTYNISMNLEIIKSFMVTNLKRVDFKKLVINPAIYFVITAK